MRTRNSILNFISIYGFFLIRVILDISKITMFKTYYGDNLVTLNGIFVNVFNYVNIVEGGLGIAILYRLYKPLVENDYDKINSLYTTLKKMFARIGFIVTGGCLVVVFAIPFLIKDNPFDFGFIFMTFLLYITRNILSYFLIAPRFIIQADHKMYKINVILYGGKVVEVLSEIAALMLGFPYWAYLLPASVIRVVQCLLINRKVKKEYPWLKEVESEEKIDLSADIKNLVVIKGVDLVHNNSDPLLLSSFWGSHTHNVYYYYKYIMKFCRDTVEFLYNSLKSGLGQFFVVNTKEDILKELNRLKITYSFIGVTLVVALNYAIQPFISLWMGADYLVSEPVKWMFLTVIYLEVMMFKEKTVLEIYGMFEEMRNRSMIAALVNITISFILVGR
ncbi:MAG: hypothetical protein IJL94_04015, partial [Erysipelotrichaceae bacterium]|nr:hypothetical protein [Erysipelotrichaceae bacterium]